MKNLFVPPRPPMTPTSPYQSPAGSPTTSEGSPLAGSSPAIPSPDTSAFVRYLRAEKGFHNAAIALGFPDGAPLQPSPSEPVAPLKAEISNLKVALSVEQARSQMLEARYADLHRQFVSCQQDLEMAKLAFAQARQQIPPSQL